MPWQKYVKVDLIIRNRAHKVIPIPRLLLGLLKRNDNWILTKDNPSCMWLIVYCLSSHSRIFHSYGDVTITGERLQILTYTRRLRPLSSEGSLACHTCCDTGHPFLRSSPRTRDIHTCCRAFGSGTVTTCVNDLGLSRPGFEHPTFRMRGERSTDWATAAVKASRKMTV